MTFQATCCIVGDIFFIVLFIHLRLVMAAETCPRLGTRGVAAGTITIGITMAHGEAVIERSALPCRGVMALRALSCEVVGWFVVHMARLAVGRSHSLVIESAVAPRRGVMALCTLPFEVVGWFVVHMARLAVGRSHSLVVEGAVAPCRSVMAL